MLQGKIKFITWIRHRHPYVIINHKENGPELVHMGLVWLYHTQKNEESLCHFYEDVTLMKVFIAFYNCNSYFFLPELRYNKLLHMHILVRIIWRKWVSNLVGLGLKSNTSFPSKTLVWFLKNTSGKLRLPPKSLYID